MSKALRKTIRIAFLGDVHLGSARPMLDAGLNALLAGCDHVVVNLESPICEPTPIDSSKILLRTEPGLESVFPGWHVTAATLANNHMFDHGDEGLHSTCRALASGGIHFAGAGDTARDAARPLILDSDGLSVGVIACTESATQARIATSDAPGCNHLELSQIAQQVQDLKRQVEVVIVTPHWGLCDYGYPPADVFSTGELLLNVGADIVIGHHSHVVQGIRRREDGKTVVYSLGDFFFDAYKAGRQRVVPNEENRKGLIVIVELAAELIVNIRPVFTHRCGLVIDHDQRSERPKELAQRSAPLECPQCYPARWRTEVRTRLLRRLVFWANPVHWRYMRVATVRAVLLMGREVLVRRLCKTRRPASCAEISRK